MIVPIKRKKKVAKEMVKDEKRKEGEGCMLFVCDWGLLKWERRWGGEAFIMGEWCGTKGGN